MWSKTSKYNIYLLYTSISSALQLNANQLIFGGAWIDVLPAASSGILLPVANNILAALNSTKVELMLYIVVRQQYTALIDL